MTVPANAAAASVAANVPAQESEFPPVSRLQMLEYLNGRDWWSFAQRALVFSAFLWGWFLFLAYVRADVEGAFQVHDALAQHFLHVVAHPSLSGIPVIEPVKTPLPCRCACRPEENGFAQSPCERNESEVLDFVGLLQPMLASQLLQSHQGQLGEGPEVPLVRWDDISNVEDAWFWVEHGLLPDVWNAQGGQSLLRPGLILQRNLVLGGIRARQKRAQLAQDCQVVDSLRSLYMAKCRSSELQTSAYGPHGGLSGAAKAAFQPSAAASEAGEEGFFDAAFDVERPLSDALVTAEHLREHRWLDGATRSLEVQAVLLNAEAGFYALLSVSFTFPFHGGVEKRVGVRPFRALATGLAIEDLIWLALIFRLVVQEGFQLSVAAYHKRCKEYFSDLWNVVDWVSIFLGVAILIYWYTIVSNTAAIAEDVGSLPRTPLPTNLDAVTYRASWGKVLDDSFHVFELKQYHHLCLFWYTTVISLRFLKGFLGQAKLAMIQISLARSFWDVAHVIIIFLVLFVNFACGGRILFGEELAGWSNFAQAAGSCVRMLMGSSLFDEMYEVGPVSATIWFWLFLLTMVFVLMNLLLVIIIDNYVSYRRAIGPTQGIVADACLAWNDLLWRLSWRKDMFSDGEYKACFWESPYVDLADSLVEAAKVSEEMEVASRASCLGLKLCRKQMEDMSAEGLAAEGHPGAMNTYSLELREMGCDAMTAEHLLEVCSSFVEREKKVQSQSQLQQIRQFVKVLRSHRAELSRHCEAIEAGVEEEQAGLFESMDRLEASVQEALEGFQCLRETGVETLAPPPPGQTGVMRHP